MKKLLALDVGEKRIGVAISTSVGRIPRPYGTLSNINQQQTIKKIKEICQKEGVAKVIIGLPLNLRGGLGKQADKIKDFAERLSREIDVPIFLEDERFTTKEAEKILKAEGKKKIKEKIDAISALLILRQYLDREDEE